MAIYGCYALRALRWKVLQSNLGPSSFWTIYKLTLAGFSAVFLLGRAGEPIRPLLLARKEKLPVADMFGLYVFERLFDAASTAVIAGLGLLLFQARVQSGTRTWRVSRTLETAAKTTGSFLFHRRGWRRRCLDLPAAARHGVAGAAAAGVAGTPTAGAQIRRGSFWALPAACRQFVPGATWRWRCSIPRCIGFWCVDLRLGVAQFGGKLATISFGDALLVLAFTMVGSAVQVPGVGGGSQAGFLSCVHHDLWSRKRAGCSRGDSHLADYLCGV